MQFLLLLLAVFLQPFAQAHINQNNGILSDSGIRGPKYQVIQQQLKSLSELYPEKITLIDMGKTIAGKAINGLLFKDKSLGQTEKLIFISGATHGNEYLNIVDRLVFEFAKEENTEFQDYFARGGAIFVVPIVNPDGYDSRSRFNKSGADLNRDFPNDIIKRSGFVEPETRQLGEWLANYMKREQPKFEVAVDYHCCNGSLLYPYSYTRKAMKTADLEAHVKIAEMMQKQLPKYKHGITGRVLGYYPAGTSKDFWYMKYGALAFTFEGKYGAERKNLDKHIAWWKDIVGAL